MTKRQLVPRRVGETLACVLAASALAMDPILAADGRIPLHEPTIITQSGSYYLTRDISTMAGHAIQVRAPHVRIDLNGHTLIGPGAGGASAAIMCDDQCEDLDVRGGILVRFNPGIWFGGKDPDPMHFRVEDVTIRDSGTGIRALGDPTAGPLSVVITKSSVVNCASDGVVLQDTAGARIEGNLFAQVGGAAISLLGAPNTHVANNHMDPVGSGLSALASDNVAVVGDHITYEDDCVRARSSNGVTLFSLHCACREDCSVGECVDFADVVGCAIIYTDCYGNPISVDRTGACEIKWNAVTDSDSYGILATASSSHLVIDENVCLRSAREDIRIDGTNCIYSDNRTTKKIVAAAGNVDGGGNVSLP